MQIAMYPSPVDIDGYFNTFMPLLPDGWCDQAGTGFYSIKTIFQVGCPLGQRNPSERIDRGFRRGGLM